MTSILRLDQVHNVLVEHFLTLLWCCTLTRDITVCLIATLTILGHFVAPLFCIVHIVLTNLPDLFIDLQTIFVHQQLEHRGRDLTIFISKTSFFSMKYFLISSS